MCRFIETIRIEEGRIYNLLYHNQRLNQTRKAVFGIHTELNLSGIIDSEKCRERTKCRVEYGEEICKVEYFPYNIRPVHSLRLICCDDIDYHYKSTNREQLDDLFAKRGAYDDILIVKNGLVTDTSICNIAFWNGARWVTPAQPLLPGTKRASLLSAGMLVTKDIAIDTLGEYLSYRLFNAMIDFGELEPNINSIGR